MDSELAAIAAAGGAAIAQAMATDAWGLAKSKLLHFFRSRGWSEMDATVNEMDYERLRLPVGAQGEETDPETWEAWRRQWSGALEQFLESEPESSEELQELIAELTQLSESAPVVARQHVSSGRDAYVAGRDQNIVVHNREAAE